MAPKKKADNFTFQFSSKETMGKIKEKLAQVKKIINEGQAQKIILTDKDGRTVVEMPLVVAAVGVLVAPEVVILGAAIAFCKECTVTVIKKETEAKAA